MLFTFPYLVKRPQGPESEDQEEVTIDWRASLLNSSHLGISEKTQSDRDKEKILNASKE